MWLESNKKNICTHFGNVWKIVTYSGVKKEWTKVDMQTRE